MKSTFTCIVGFVLMVCGVLVSPGASMAQDRPVKYLGIESGLSNNSVTSVLQDQFGYIWLGTYDGVNRYDGYDFKTFHNEWGDPHSLINNHIKSVAIAGNRMFVGTEKGLMYLDFTDSKFHSLYFAGADKQPTKIDFIINQVIADREGNIYAGTGANGLIRFQGTDTVGIIVPLKASKPNYSAQAMALDGAGHMMLFINGKGLGLYNAKSKSISLVNKDLLLAGCMIIDNKNTVWIGTSNGVYTFKDHRLTRFDDEQHHLSATNISCLYQVSNGDIWIGTNGAGINIWNPEKGNIRYLVPGESQTSLRSGAVFGIFEDKEKRIWIATLRGGVNIIDSRPVRFVNYTYDAANKYGIPNNFVRSFCEDELHNVWVGFDGSGLSYWNRKTDTFSSYPHPGAGTVGSNFVVSIVKDYQNKIWTATFNGGIDALDKKSGAFKHYTCLKPGTNIEEKNFWNLYEDNAHNLWAGSTWGGTIYHYNRASDRFEVLDPGLADIHALYVDHSGRMWGGDYRRLILLDPIKRKHKSFFVGQAIRAITEDHNGQLWVGTEGGGLLKFEPATGRFKRYTSTDGLPSNSVLTILVDERNNLWCSTYHGLANLNTATGKFTNYFASDGLQSNQFLYGAALRLSSGEMIFGGIKGLSLFNPTKVAAYVHVPTLLLTDFKINNVSVADNADYSAHQPLNALKEIEIPYDQASLALSYTALEYSYPEKINYAYYLENWDHNWNYVGKLKTAYFSRLNEGHYVLKIKSTDTQGIWSKPYVLRITVLPPWYRTWWAYLFYICSVSTIVYWIWLYRIRQTRLKYEVTIANLKVEQEKEANERKLSFFTNVSHEFRTPLTLIINPIKDMLKLHKAPGDELNIVYRNASRLLGLVDQLLMFRKSESENADVKVSVLNFTDVCREIYNCFTHQAKIKLINYTFESTEPEIEIFADREKIEIALFNLISNAIKFTPQNGNITVTVKQDNESVYFEIADSGIGISADVGEKLFDKFYQVKDPSSLKTGFGIGLYLVKNFIELHKGTITFHSTSGEGTTFVLCLPKGNAHLAGYQMVETTPGKNSYVEELIDADSTEAVAPEEPVANDIELMISTAQSILVIDDDVDIRDYIKKIFERDYTVYEAENGAIGLDLIRKVLPDVVISDINMPNLTGLELCRLVKQDSQLSHIPIILLTGEQAPEMKLQGIEEGAVDFLSKPFDKDLLVARVKGIIKNKKELQHYFFNEVTRKNNSRNISEENKQFLYKCIDIIENSLLDPVLDVNTIADKMGMSYSNLYKKIKNVTGQSINGFIRFVRLRKSAELLIETNCNVNEAAFRVGFSDVKYFRENFNKQFGLNPSEFIKKHRVNFQNTPEKVKK
ncbi:response regulator [Mucilaginibacter sp. HMF5004]|uniref:hybrid sensor histidine kinase/response regulator transcription factor n=1 Tax=Mucilaginibacter rivuli TaxID=2857527 RepID=UPI001C5EFA8C|nr:two-component regulator propeller domain-containing protein [Mucilaginibacter rivuli]MBW4891037.1 response regulator [Mucilaginibacter rivuli]